MRSDGAEQSNGQLMPWLIAVALALAVFHAVVAILWGPGPVIAVLPWYVPMVYSWAAVAAAGIAFVALGRYRVLREPAPFWIGMGFSTFAVLAIFYVLSWPGLLPGERGLIARLDNTPTGFLNLQLSALAVFLPAATLAPWPRAGAPGERLWPWAIAAGIAASVVVPALSLAFEPYMPILEIGGAWTSLQFIWFYALLAAFGAGALMSAQRYRETGDSLVAYVALTQLVLAFFVLAGITGGKRYDLWWYWQHVLLVAGFSAMLFGLLSEYVSLYRREREKTRELEALQRVTDPTLARKGLDRLLQSLLHRIVGIMGANAGAILLLDRARHELVLKKAVGIPERHFLGFRMRVGEDFAGRVAARNAVFWVRDIRAAPDVSTPYIQAARIKAMIGAPMRIDADVIGVVHVDFLEPREFTPHEERLLEVVAERAALAIRQASLLEQAQQERGRLQLVIDTAPSGIMLFSGPDGRLELYNKTAEDILGRPLVPGAPIEDQPALRNLYRANGEPFPPDELPPRWSLGGESCTGVELLVRHPSGRKLFILVNSAPLRDARNQVIGSITAFQDITPIKEQDALRDEFISAAAHELKTPVTTIKGYAQLMRQWAPEGHEPREGKAIQVISAQADRINRRVEEMLEVVRSRTVRPALHRVRFDLGELAAQVVPRMQAATQIHRIVLRREGPVPVEADLEHIEEVLVSLLDNAIKYSPQGGEIEVRVWTQDGEAVVAVKDHGVGIPKDRQPHIFEPFYEAVPPGAPGYRSVVALSLYLAKLTVERHKGRIWFESEEGKGSTFYFSLPLARERVDGKHE